MTGTRFGEIAPQILAKISKIYESPLQSRLMEMGFLEGTWVKIIHEAPFSKDPIAVQVRGAIIALRRNEANMIEVIVDEKHG